MASTTADGTDYTPYTHGGFIWLVKYRPSRARLRQVFWIVRLVRRGDERRVLHFMALREHSGASFDVFSEDDIDVDTWVSLNTVATRHHEAMIAGVRRRQGTVVRLPVRSTDEDDHPHLDLGDPSAP